MQNKAVTPFKVIQGHRFWYQSKPHMWLLIKWWLIPPILPIIGPYLHSSGQRHGSLQTFWRFTNRIIIIIIIKRRNVMNGRTDEQTGGQNHSGCYSGLHFEHWGRAVMNHLTAMINISHCWYRTLKSFELYLKKGARGTDYVFPSEMLVMMNVIVDFKNQHRYSEVEFLDTVQTEMKSFLMERVSSCISSLQMVVLVTFIQHYKTKQRHSSAS